jgi:hypothetical protein
MNVVIGQVMYIEHIGRRGCGIYFSCGGKYNRKELVTVSGITPKGRITVAKEDGTKKTFLPNGNEYGGGAFHSSRCNLNPLKEGTVKEFKDRIAQEERANREEQDRVEAEAKAKAKEHRDCIEAFWTYRGKKLWENATEIPTVAGSAKCVTYIDKYGYHVTAFAIVTPEKDLFHEGKIDLKVKAIGFQKNEYGVVTSSRDITAIDEKEIIFDLVN